MAELKTFALKYLPGPSWVEGRSVYEQDLRAHGDYMDELFQAGKTLMAGPFSDSSGGLCVLRIDSEEEAREIVAKDPGVNSGVLKVSIHPWHVVFAK